MSGTRNPNRTSLFRLVTIASSAFGAFLLGMWGLRFGDGLAGITAQAMVGIVGGLCALSAAGAAMSFFAGVDESADYVFRETQLDKLTGLLARAAMVGKVAEAAAAAIRTGKPVYLIDIDIDRFKHINDAIGYSQGDALVHAFAERLKTLMPEGATIGRLGAGEFAILYPDDKLQGSMEHLVERLIETMMQPYQLSSHLQSVSLSVGVVAMPMNGVDPVVVLRRSNLALQHARLGGHGNWAVFQPEMGRVADFRQWVEAELHAQFLALFDGRSFRGHHCDRVADEALQLAQGAPVVRHARHRGVGKLQAELVFHGGRLRAQVLAARRFGEVSRPDRVLLVRNGERHDAMRDAGEGRRVEAPAQAIVEGDAALLDRGLQTDALEQDLMHPAGPLRRGAPDERESGRNEATERRRVRTVEHPGEEARRRPPPFRHLAHAGGTLCA